MQMREMDDTDRSVRQCTIQLHALGVPSRLAEGRESSLPRFVTTEIIDTSDSRAAVGRLGVRPEAGRPGQINRN